MLSEAASSNNPYMYKFSHYYDRVFSLMHLSSTIYLSSTMDAKEQSTRESPTKDVLFRVNPRANSRGNHIDLHLTFFLLHHAAPDEALHSHLSLIHLRHAKYFSLLP